MQIAFYRGDGGLFSRLIAWWTGTVKLDDGRVIGPFTHVELIFSSGRWFSSHEAEGGTRFCEKYTAEQARRDPRWLVIDLPLSPAQEAQVLMRAYSIHDLGYDWWGIWKTAWRPSKQSHDRWFCSEACLYCLQAVGLFPGTPPWRATPVDLAALVIAVFGKAGEW